MKRGVELSMNVIIIAAIALIILVVLVLLITGAFVDKNTPTATCTKSLTFNDVLLGGECSVNGARAGSISVTTTHSQCTLTYPIDCAAFNTSENRTEATP